MPPRVGLCLLEDPQLQELWKLHSSLHNVNGHCIFHYCLHQTPGGTYCLLSPYQAATRPIACTFWLCKPVIAL